MQLFNLIKSIFRSVIVFLDVIVNQVGSHHEVRTSEQKGYRVTIEFVSVVYECNCSKQNAVRNFVKYNKVKISN